MNTNKTLITAFAVLAMTATTYADFKKRPGGRADRYVFVQKDKQQAETHLISTVNVKKVRNKVRNQTAKKKTKRSLRRYGRRP